MPGTRRPDLYPLGLASPHGGPDATAVAPLPPALREVPSDRLQGCSVEESGRDRTSRAVRRFDEPLLDLDDVADVVEDLTSG